MYPKELIRLLQKNGWKIKSQNGSHIKLTKDGKVSMVALHNTDIPKGTLNSILKKAGLK